MSHQGDDNEGTNAVLEEMSCKVEWLETQKAGDGARIPGRRRRTGVPAHIYDRKSMHTTRMIHYVVSVFVFAFVCGWQPKTPIAFGPGLAPLEGGRRQIGTSGRRGGKGIGRFRLKRLSENGRPGRCSEIVWPGPTVSDRENPRRKGIRLRMAFGVYTPWGSIPLGLGPAAVEWADSQMAKGFAGLVHVTHASAASDLKRADRSIESKEASDKCTCIPCRCMQVGVPFARLGIRWAFENMADLRKKFRDFLFILSSLRTRPGLRAGRDDRAENGEGRHSARSPYHRASIGTCHVIAVRRRTRSSNNSRQEDVHKYPLHTSGRCANPFLLLLNTAATYTDDLHWYIQFNTCIPSRRAESYRSFRSMVFYQYKGSQTVDGRGAPTLTSPTNETHLRRYQSVCAMMIGSFVEETKQSVGPMMCIITLPIMDDGTAQGARNSVFGMLLPDRRTTASRPAGGWSIDMNDYNACNDPSNTGTVSVCFTRGRRTYIVCWVLCTSLIHLLNSTRDAAPLVRNDNLSSVSLSTWSADMMDLSQRKNDFIPVKSASAYQLGFYQHDRAFREPVSTTNTKVETAIVQTQGTELCDGCGRATPEPNSTMPDPVRFGKSFGQCWQVWILWQWLDTTVHGHGLLPSTTYCFFPLSLSLIFE
ncbi:hypothetical protein ACRALDRAFT_1094152 [Sodiomyces alcalophilus JCM 7366]|uniref:uncharacterized protein n=1 Tax=Sodiomyces alcalophilus JCM 7366 TaxID=591952 RepID=UPI0039B6C35F